MWLHSLIFGRVLIYFYDQLLVDDEIGLITKVPQRK